jgi:hypothetical protein
MMKKLTVNIPKPCAESWDQMTKTEQGRHCASCDKVVIDFSQMSDHQIYEALLQYKGKKVCGNFYVDQVHRPMYYIKNRRFEKWPAIAAMLVAGFFQLNQGNLNAQINHPKQICATESNLEKNPYKDVSKKTEPASDSLITYTIRVFNENTKEKLSNITVDIDSVGIFTTDKNGEVKLSLEMNKVPKMIKIQFSSWNYEVKDLTFAKSRLSRTKNMEIYLKEVERMMMRGDVGPDYHGN